MSKKVKKRFFFKRENKDVSFLAASKIATRFARIAMIFSKFIL